MSSFQEIFGQGGFVTNSVAPATDYAIIPPGKYPCTIESAEVKLTKKQDGYYLELVLVILEGEYANYKIWDRINIANPSAQCQKIGRGTLAALNLALGIANLENESQVVGGVVVAHVKVKNEQNEVRTYSSLTDYRAEQAAAQAPVQAPVVAQQPVQQVQPVVVQQQQAAVREQPQPQQQCPAQPVHVQGTTPWARPT